MRAAGCALRLAGYLSVPLVFAVLPVSLVERGPCICLFRNLLGIECPGCGMTRALCLIMHGDVVSALAHNRAVLLVFPLLAFLVVRGFLTELSAMGGRAWLAQRKEVSP